jgi:PAS domain S-box-containing protein
MTGIVILSASIVVQCLTAWFAFRLIKVTGRSAAWLLISVALVLMAARRGISLLEHFTVREVRPLDPVAETVALAISLCMFGGIKLIRPIFEERQQAEQEIALLSFALNSVHEAVFLLDPEARFRFVNEESCRTLEYSREELQGMELREIVAEAPAQCWRDRTEKRALIFEGRCRSKTGRDFLVEISANHFEFGGKAYTLALARDITERKRSEETLRKLNLELDQRVQERTRELEAKNQELARMNKLFVGRELKMAEMKKRMQALGKMDADAENNQNKGTI